MNEKNKTTLFDWQGHRGARGLLPENTVMAFLEALKYPAVKTLEMDVAVTKDGQIILSHEPWMSAEICSLPDGSPIDTATAEQHLIYNMTVAEVQRYDCGKRGHPRFPQQQAQAAHKPTLQEVVVAVNAYCVQHKRQAPFYNIEMKSEAQWDNLRHPAPDAFAALLLKEIKRLGIYNRTCIQSFDVRCLQAMRRLDDKIILALLVENLNGLSANLQTLGFAPNIYSPNYYLLTPEVIEQCHQKNMLVIPWTVNDTAEMHRLIALGIDGIITDYPNLIPAASSHN
ncbi:MAG: glycerophosphodiester phosphodiesterase [Saprospiraceae bacterium]|nr:glycerophosphodiester phosphodiesterase [Saprospiraceae bacterium]